MAVSARAVLIFAAASGFVAVAMGAIGAHALKGQLGAEALGWVDTGVRYQAWHALGLLAAGILLGRRQDRMLRITAVAWMAGTVLFSGSLYLLAFTGERSLAMITPLGGIALLAGWAALAYFALRARLG